MVRPPAAIRELSGWGQYPRERCRVFRPEQRGELAAALAAGGDGGLIARGMGRSYGDEALHATGAVVLMTRLNRFLALDPVAGVLECEAGVTLAEIIEVALPHGLFLPVTPGTKFVTVGGAIANDVHGKNHHRDGSFAGCLQGFDLLTAGGEVLACSRETHADAFWATLGGLGLTGVITRARLRLLRVESAFLAVDYARAADLDQAIALFDRHEADYPYSVAWIDCLAPGRALGRSLLMHARHASAADARAAGAADPMRPPPRRVRGVPLELPGGLLNPLTTRAFNALYYARPRPAGRLEGYDAFFYPLDAVEHWNRIYGRRGFVQCQALLPPAGGREALVALLEKLRAARRASFLAVLKRMGPASGGLLSFPGPGWTLALDMPTTADLPGFMDGLHELILRHGGRVYLAKDATLRPAHLRAMYPALPRFLEVKRRLDPEGRICSSLARRLEIAGGAS